MALPNTLNVCVGHLPFPKDYRGFVDLGITPEKELKEDNFVLVEHNRFGQNGFSLSEYGQLIWLLENISSVSSNIEYFRVFHYRRFVARNPPSLGERSINHPWSVTIQGEQLFMFSDDFSRLTSEEVFNTPIQFERGILGQYAVAHILEDLLHFAQYLVECGIFNPSEAVNFLQEKQMIPACSVGVWHRQTFSKTFHVLARAACFLFSRHYREREGSQRRSVGFLLERLHSHLLLNRVRQGLSPHCFGHQIVISDSTFVSASI